MAERTLAEPAGEASQPSTGMDRRRLVVRAIALLTVVQIAIGAGLIAGSLNGPQPEQWGFRGFETILATALVVLGVLVATRRSGNRIGWLFLITALVVSTQQVAGEYSRYSVIAAGGPDALANWASWFEGTTWPVPVFALSVGLFSTFPDGHLRSPRWRWIIVAGALGGVLAIVSTAVTPTINSTTARAFHNPIGIAGYDALLSAVNSIGLVIMIATMFAALIALILRLRHAEGAERKQLEWVTAASALVPVACFFYGPFPSKLTETLIVLALMAIPAAAGVAILRYRLYDIDLIISRTLVYVPLTAFLAGLYSASTALFQRIFQAVTGDRSDAAIIISALVLAAVFTPAKNWLQAKVDRRFKPDADPDHRLRAFVAEVSTSIYQVDPTRLVQRLVDEVRAATHATSVHLFLEVGHHSFQAATVDGSDAVAELVLPISVRGASGDLRLGPRASGRPYGAPERVALGEAAAAVADAVVDSSATPTATAAVAAGSTMEAAKAG